MRMILAAALLFAAPCFAQTPSTDELRGAMQACHQHQATQPAIPGIHPPVYEAGWEHCSAILEELQKRHAQMMSDEAKAATKALADKLK